jgi:phosphoribosylaminoimidazole-succinocarboxamide synthase
MLVHKADRIDAECVARGYITGSGWVDYQREQAICGIALPPGMLEAESFSETLFTPATKAETGHDENIGFEAMREIVGEAADRLRELTIAVYDFGRDFAKERGIIVADTKFEFGYVGGEITLIDEILTPDSSRFWGVDEYKIGMSPPSFDKQIVRNHLIEIDWNREPPVPCVSSDVINRTAARYREIRDLLTT